MSQSEQKIIRRAATGDRMAFRELVLEHSHAMFRLAWRLTSDESAAEDIVQEAFIKAWRKIGDFRMESSFKSWLHRITVNTETDPELRQTAIHSIAMYDGKDAAALLESVYDNASSVEEKRVVLEALVMMEEAEDPALKITRSMARPAYFV